MCAEKESVTPKSGIEVAKVTWGNCAANQEAWSSLRFSFQSDHVFITNLINNNYMSPVNVNNLSLPDPGESRLSAERQAVGTQDLLRREIQQLIAQTLVPWHA